MSDCAVKIKVERIPAARRAHDRSFQTHRMRIDQISFQVPLRLVRTSAFQSWISEPTAARHERALSERDAFPNTFSLRAHLQCLQSPSRVPGVPSKTHSRATQSIAQACALTSHRSALTQIVCPHKAHASVHKLPIPSQAPARKLQRST
jgi:hypothetical protein